MERVHLSLEEMSFILEEGYFDWVVTLALVLDVVGLGVHQPRHWLGGHCDVIV